MFPLQFTTQEEIIKKLIKVGRVHSFTNIRTICLIFYDVFKMAYYALGRKNFCLKKNSQFPITLRRNEIARIVRIVHYHHSNDKEFTISHDLTQCFGSSFTEADAYKFFENFVEGFTTDKFKRDICIDLDGLKFMYKDYESKKHTIDSEFYLPHRGKRLPWIKHTLKNSSNIYSKISGSDIELMYIAKYNLPFITEEEKCKCYWVVIVKKYKKDKMGPYKFKTAFPIFKYNDLLRRVERYEPAID